MKVVFKTDLLILVPETDAERSELAAWRAAHADHVLHAGSNLGNGLALMDLGPRPKACREPIDVSSTSPHPAVRLISNLATTPFRLDGRTYACVEAFWQSLKYEEGPEREYVAGLSGDAARETHPQRDSRRTVRYGGREIASGTREHWELMQRACWAKFTQNDDARLALLSTSGRPLTHRTRRDSRDIPGVILAEIWMGIRGRLETTEPGGVPEDGRILFYKRDRQRFGYMSNFHPAPIRIDGEVWPTTEHYYQAQKSPDLAYRQAIRSAATPGEAKRLAATPGPELPHDSASWFVRHNSLPRPDWADVKLAVMREAVLAKFTQNTELGDALRATGSADLVEDSPSDSFWGMGRDGAGQNWLGRVLMEVRNRLNTAESAAATDESAVSEP